MKLNAIMHFICSSECLSLTHVSHLSANIITYFPAIWSTVCPLSIQCLCMYKPHLWRPTYALRRFRAFYKDKHDCTKWFQLHKNKKSVSLLCL